jgi:predicted Zn-dependent protease with MMP-like domain
MQPCSRTSLTTADGTDRQAVTPPPGALCTIVSPLVTRLRPIRSATVHDGEGQDEPARRIRRRDRHGRGLRGQLVPPEVPLYRSRSEHFDDLVLLAVSQLEPRWEAELSGVEFAVEEIPAADSASDDPEPVPLARLDTGSTDTGSPEHPAHPARIVLYRRPLMARADGDEELGELVLDVVVEEFARLLGLDPQIVDPGYPGED